MHEPCASTFEGEATIYIHCRVRASERARKGPRAFINQVPLVTRVTHEAPPLLPSRTVLHCHSRRCWNFQLGNNWRCLASPLRVRKWSRYCIHRSFFPLSSSSLHLHPRRARKTVETEWQTETRIRKSTTLKVAFKEGSRPRAVAPRARSGRSR